MLAKTRVYYAGRYYKGGETIPNVTQKDAKVLLHLKRAEKAPDVKKSVEPSPRKPYVRRDMTAQAPADVGSDPAVKPSAGSDTNMKPKRQYTRRDKTAEA